MSCQVSDASSKKLLPARKHTTVIVLCHLLQGVT